MTAIPKKTALLIGAAILGLSLVIPASASAERQKPESVGPSSATSDIRTAISDGAFTEEERQKIKDYYQRRKPEGDDDGDSGDDDGDDDDDKGGEGKSKASKTSKNKDHQSKGKSSKGKGQSSSKGKSSDMPPGFTKKDELPPGLAMQLEKNGTLPPGLAKRNLPTGLNSLLPTRSTDYKRYVVENDVILLDEKTGRVMDIMRGIAATGILD
jgi:hypothetical protein